MLILKKSIALASLTLALSCTAWADCPAPGIMGGPPCVSSQMPSEEPTANESTARQQIATSSAVASEPASMDLPSLVEITLNVLTLF